ncbi:hypothetical protein [Halosimplex marinum]|uniref:hypothetical protein n=1 Tax=Halosimplex marinum TaxID=3396620 RepID=UPI003F56FA5A
MMPDDDIIDVLKDIRQWVKVIGLQQSKPVLEDALSDEDEERQRDLRITFHFTNGNNGRRAIAEKISYSRGWVRDRQEEWSNMGLIERNGSNDQYQHIISLEEAGIEIPEPRKTESEEQEENENRRTEEKPQEEAELTDYE